MEKEKKLSVNEEIEIIKKQISRERIRVNRLVQVLRNNLPEKNLSKIINFAGTDCSGYFHSYEDMTLDNFLRDVVDS